MRHLAAWGVAGLLVLLFVWQQASVDRLVLRLEREEDENQKLTSEVNALRLEANRLSSLEQVEERAVRELGLRRPVPEEIVRVEFEPEDPAFHLLPGVGQAHAAPAAGDPR
jgi:cell division protein FtsL